MRRLSHLIFLAGALLLASRLVAQQTCPGLPYVANTPEDELMQAVNGAENPQEQVAALDKFVQANPDSRFMPCVEEYYTIAYTKLNDYAKVIEHGEKGLAGSYQDMMLIMNLTNAYLASGQVSDKTFDAVMRAQAAIQAETNPPRPPKVSDAEWQKNLQELAEEAEAMRARMESSFFELLQRVTDGNKRIALMDQLVKTYPESKNVAQISFNYFLANSYSMTNNGAKAVEYGEKAVAADPNNIGILNAVADDFAIRQMNLDKAAEYARKVLDLAPGMKKPETMSDEQFKKYRDNQLGLAHSTLGYVAYQKSAKTKKVAQAIQEFKTAADLLQANPPLQGRTLFFLGYAYETNFPANHKLAAEALTRAASIAGPFQSQAQDLLAKVKKASGQ